MHRYLLVGMLAMAVVAACSTLILGATSLWLVALSGFVFVLGGSLLTTLVSEGVQPVTELLRRLASLGSETACELGEDRATLLNVATYYRRGAVRQAELQCKGLRDPLLQLGSQMIVDRCSPKELSRALHWHIANSKEQDRREIRMLQAMGGFAPAFGMLGTLLGLVQLLFNLGEGGLDVVGSAMGFAMITTVYGLVGANLIIKPIAIKREQRYREQTAWQRVKYELLLLLYEKAHPAVIEETLNAFAHGNDAGVGTGGTQVTQLASV